MDRIGTDISFWAGKTNFQQMKEAGAEYTILRAGQGNYIDRMFLENRDDSKGILPRGSYWYYDDRYDPNEQAAKYLEVLGDDRLELPLVADYESNYGGAHGGWKKLYTFLTKLKEGAPEKEIMIYTGYYYWLANSPQRLSEAASLEWFAQFPIWVAAYNSRPLSSQLIPAPWKNHHLAASASSLSSWKNPIQAFRILQNPNGPDDTIPLYKKIWLRGLDLARQKQRKTPTASAVTEPDWWFWQNTGSGNGPLYGVSAMDIDLDKFVGAESQWKWNAVPEPDPDPEPPDVSKTLSINLHITYDGKDLIYIDHEEKI